MSLLTNVVGAGKFVIDTDGIIDFVDATSLMTTNMLIAIALVQSYKQFSSNAIECLTPENIPFESAEEYAETFCFASDTYYIPMTDTVSNVHETERRQRRISYYQWVPFFLLISAACFRLPSLLWKHFSDYSGIRIQQIIKLASDANNIKPDIKDANIQSLCIHLQGALRFHRRLQQRHIRPHKLLRFFNLQYSAYYVSMMYLITKFLYLFNVTSQLYLLNSFLGTNKHAFYGFGAILDLMNGTTWEQSGVFPRVSLCDFTVRVMGNVQDYTIQCVLVINIFNEKIFIFLWFWYIFLLCFTLGSFFYWCIVAFCPCYNIGYISKHLEMSTEPFSFDDSGCQRQVRKFVRTYLKADGMFAIRMLSTYSGVIFGTELVSALFRRFRDIEQQRLYRPKSDSELNKIDIQKRKGSSRKNSPTKMPLYHDDWAEERTLIPPPTPPSDIMRAVFNKSTDSLNASPTRGNQYATPPVRFTAGPEANTQPPSYQGQSHGSAPGLPKLIPLDEKAATVHGGTVYQRRAPSDAHTSPKRQGGHNSDNSSVL